MGVSESAYYYIQESLIQSCSKAPEAEGDPCDPVTGRNYQSQKDYTNSTSRLNFSRFYSSWKKEGQNNPAGSHWRYSFSASMLPYNGNYSDPYQPEVSREPLKNTQYLR